MHKENLRQVLPTQWLQPQKVRYKGDAAPDKHSRNQEKPKCRRRAGFACSSNCTSSCNAVSFGTVSFIRCFPFPGPLATTDNPKSLKVIAINAGLVTNSHSSHREFNVGPLFLEQAFSSFIFFALQSSNS